MSDALTSTLAQTPATRYANDMRFPWQDRTGTLSGYRLAALLIGVAPAFWIATQVILGWLGPRPITTLIHETGDWALRLLILVLAVTPLRRVLQWPRLVLVRRNIGIAVSLYAGAHFLLYVIDQKGDLAKVASEIVLRFYLTIGFVALAGLIALGATSSDAAIRRLGSAGWNRLHSLVYPIALLALWHFALQKKLDVSEPMLMTGLFFWLMGYRILHRRLGAVGLVALIGLSLGSGMATALVEAAWYGVATGLRPQSILLANFDFSYVIRPAWWVLCAGLITTGAMLLRRPKERQTIATA